MEYVIGASAALGLVVVILAHGLYAAYVKVKERFKW